MPEVPIILKPVLETGDLVANLVPDRRLRYEESRELDQTVREIIDQVAQGGDRACQELTQRYDQVTVREFRVAPAEIDRARSAVPEKVLLTLNTAIDQIRDFHSRQSEQSWWYERSGTQMGEIRRAVASVAAYVPGGRYPYPSSVLMTVIPAQLAGVPRIALFTPPGRLGNIAPEILAAASLLGIEEIYRLGGAQAVAAACFGTETIPAVDLIVGPGNRYVTVAKKLLQGIVGIDSLAGPSEVVILAEPPAPPTWVALDLLAQAEHDPLARAILFSPNEGFLLSVKTALERELANQPLPFVREVPIYLLQTESRDQAIFLAEVLAPEHLEVMLSETPGLPSRLIRAGAWFIGAGSCVAAGDYGLGPNHVIPTSGGSRFSSPLSVRHFVTTSSFVSQPDESPPEGYEELAHLARLEGLIYHEKSLLARLGKSRLPEWVRERSGQS
ncbi:MAG TPA: histidinol dehydrogenase [Atribacteraceae bacterium]|nr:histidinol dehydrogenase [Atribacteraceae bacterium]